LPALVNLLSSSKEGIRKEACWTISNITAGNTEQIQAVIDAGIFSPLINLLASSDLKTKKEACWAVSNATSGGLAKPEQIRYLVELGCIRPLCDLLSSMDNKIIQVTLDALENILKVGELDKSRSPSGNNDYAYLIEECGGMEKIHNSQQNANQDIYLKAYHIIEKSTHFLTFADVVDISATTRKLWTTMLHHRKQEVSSNLEVNGVDNHSKVDSISLVIERHCSVSFFFLLRRFEASAHRNCSHSATVLVSCKHVAFIGNRFCDLESCR